MAVLIVLWPYLLTSKLRCLQKNNTGHTKLGVEEDRVKRWFTHRRQAWKKGNKSQSHKSLKKKKQIDPKAAFNPNSFQHKLLKRSLITGK